MKVILLNNTMRNNHLGCYLVTKSIFELLLNRNIHIFHSVYLGENWENINNITLIKMSDLVIINAEGTIHHDSFNGMRLADAVTRIYEMKKKVVLINAVFEANSPELYSKLKNANAIFVRESRSLKELQEHGINADVVPDLIFEQSSFFKTSFENTVKKIIITDSVNPKVTRNLLIKTRDLVIDGHELLRLRIIYNELSKTKIPITSSVNRFSRSILTISPLKFIYLLRSLKNYLLNHAQFRTLNFYSLTSQISNANMLISGRFHVICIAIINETPFIALPSNTHKTIGLLEDIGLSDRYFQTLPSVTIIQDLARLSRYEIDLIRKYKLSSHNKITKMFDVLEGLI